MGEFPNAYDWPKLKSAEINNLKRFVIIPNKLYLGLNL